MAVMFPTLGKDTVHIGIGKGKWIDVDMLPVSDYARFREISAEIASIPDTSPQEFRMQKVKEAREEFIAMAQKVMPVEMHDNVERLNHLVLTGLVNTLCTGEDDSEKDDPKKKITLKSQMSRNQKKK